MSKNTNPTRVPPDESIEQKDIDDVLVNDSLGTTSLADSTGSDEAKETGDAKDKNKNTKED